MPLEVYSFLNVPQAFTKKLMTRALLIPPYFVTCDH